MSDIRFRTAIAAILSITAFSGGIGAVAALLWWWCFSAQKTFQALSWRTILKVSIIAAGFPGLVLILFGNSDGLIYAFKIFVILLISFWLGAVHRPGEFLNLGVWAFGKKHGFDLGLTAELSLQFLRGILDDYTHIKTALLFKEKKLSITTLPGVGIGLLMLSLSRAKNTAEILARRGYQSGGSYQPDFATATSDYIQLLLAIFCGISAVVAYSIPFY